jgi:hypothetical protein
MAKRKAESQIGNLASLSLPVTCPNTKSAQTMLSQPHFEASVRMKLTLPKMGTWSPSGLPKTQSLIAGVKTPRIEVFFILLERSWSVDVQNGLPWIILTSVAQVMVERKAGSQTGTKSRELTRSRCVQVDCDTSLEKFLRRTTTLLQTSSQSEVWAGSYELPKSRESEPR